MLSKLGDNITPTQYNLIIKHETGEYEFDGEMMIKVNIKTPTNQIILNASFIVLSVEVNKIAQNYYRKHDLLKIVGSFKAGKNEIRIKFLADRNGQTCPHGFFATDSGIYLTRFNPGKARLSFPCFDQPEMKATFKVTLVIPKDITVISNTEEEERKMVGNEIVVKFKETPLLPTHLVSWVIGPLEYISQGRIRIFTENGKKKYAKLVLKFAVAAMELFEEYFNHQYPLGKLDIVAIKDFPKVSKSCLGLITFQENSLLYAHGPGYWKTSYFSTEIDIAENICHALSLQWIGNIVTIKWWNDVWLYEGIATWMACFMAHRLDFHSGTKFWFNVMVEEELARGSLPYSLSVVSQVCLDPPLEKNRRYKEASIINLLADYQKESFRSGMIRFLHEKKWDNATSVELMEYLNFDFKKWTNQPGFPLITIHKDNRISQERFTFSKNQSKDTWNVVFKIMYFNHGEEWFVLKDKEATFIPKHDLFKVNSGALAFIRVKYEDENIPLRLLRTNLLSLVDRFGIFYDTYSLIRGRHFKIDYFLSICEMFREEKNAEGLKIVLELLFKLRMEIQGKRNKIDKLIISICANCTILDSYDANVFDMRYCKVENAVFINHTKTIDFLVTHKIDKAFRDLKLIAIGKSKKNNTSLIEKYKAANDLDIKRGALIACTQVKSKRAVLGLIDELGNCISKDDVDDLFFGLSLNLNISDDLVEIVIKKWEIFKKIFRNENRKLNSILKHTFSFVSDEKFNKAVSFLNEIFFDEINLSVEKLKDELEVMRLLREFNS